MSGYRISYLHYLRIAARMQKKAQKESTRSGARTRHLRISSRPKVGCSNQLSYKRTENEHLIHEYLCKYDPFTHANIKFKLPKSKYVRFINFVSGPFLAGNSKF